MRNGWLLGLILGLALLPQVAFGITVSTTDVSGAPGQTVPVAVNVKDIDAALQISGIDFALDYNESVLSVSSVERGTLTADWSTLPNMSKSGVLKVGLYTVNPLPSAEGSILVVMFNIKDNAPAGQYPLHVSTADFNEKRAATITDGNIIVAPGKAIAPGKPVLKAPVAAEKISQSTVMGIMKKAEFKIPIHPARKPGALQLQSGLLSGGVFVTGFDCTTMKLSVLSLGTQPKETNVAVVGKSKLADGKDIVRHFVLKID